MVLVVKRVCWKGGFMDEFMSIEEVMFYLDFKINI